MLNRNLHFLLVAAIMELTVIHIASQCCQLLLREKTRF